MWLFSIIPSGGVTREKGRMTMPDFVVLVNLTGCPLDSAKDNVLHNNIASVKIKNCLMFMRQKFSWFILSFFIYCCVLVL